MLTGTYVKHSHQSKTYDEFYDMMERDRFMSPEEAVEWGVIDEVVDYRTVEEEDEI
jgi:ATP-dependent Clp protease protease subunit